MAYCTAAEVKTYLSITDTDDDALLATLIAQAQATIDTYTHRTFEASADATKTFDAVDDVDGDTLYLDMDLCAITSITNGDDTVLASTDYVTEPRRRTPYYAIKMRSDSNEGWTYDDAHEGAISIVGRWAYSTTAPDDIKRACIRLTAWLYQQKDTGFDVDRVMLSNDGMMLAPQTMPRDVVAMLKPYRRL